MIKLESASAFFVGGGVVSFFALVAFTNGVEAVFVPKLLFALFAFASSPCKNSLFSTSSSELTVSALSLFAEDALLAMDFSMDIAEFMIPDPEDNRRWMLLASVWSVYIYVYIHEKRERKFFVVSNALQNLLVVVVVVCVCVC